MTSIPSWAALCAAVGTPVLAFAGVLVAQLITRRGADELELRSRREETLRVLRWAAELAMSDDPAKVRLGLSQLEALGDSELLDSAQQLFVDAAVLAVVGMSTDEAGSDDADIVRLPRSRLRPVRSDDESGERDDD